MRTDEMRDFDCESSDIPPFTWEQDLPEVSVGGGNCDIPGFSNLQIQAAVERVAALGGGIVRLSPGVFKMRDSLHLRTNVLVRGAGPETVLKKEPMKKSRLIAFMGYGHRAFDVAEPDLFEPGDGVLVSSAATGGFLDTVATLVRKEGATWIMDRPACMDYSNSQAGCVRTLFPLVEASQVRNAVLEDLVLDGNSSENEMLNGCRGGAFYAYRSSGVIVRKVNAVNFNGDGFSFQTCKDVQIDSCSAESCSGHGFHPGSGSARCAVRRSSARKCGECGLFYCLKVRDTVVEDCVFEGNRSHGLLVWARDDDNTNRKLTIRHNGGCGISFMDTPPGQESSRQTFEECVLEENAARDGNAEIFLIGGGSGIRLIRNKIVRRPGIPAILVARGMPRFENVMNEITPAGPDAIVNQT